MRHLRSLILGQSNETVIAVGGNLVAKRSMYRKMFAVVAIYPVIFAAGVIWNVESQADKWAWVSESFNLYHRRLASPTTLFIAF